MDDKKANEIKPANCYAAALRYQPDEDRPPRVTVTGRGDLARAIREMAESHGVPVYEDGKLAETLCKLAVNTEIPPELYEVVARILVYVARIDHKLP
ncbi:EscU/YscU/HrcU family type III secretion system export apparatus switch protein [Desulfoscipio gibsoniae]|uniref:Flagellar biosynthesis pathway, component FlhB n=1 Tax=Desulfoscipio gibsoniae DSM 7213 TaxID=767817 RepID=R4KPT6_9FIRM|nr:EscU/YscU/HrcU family type III secretion system export apparatus switch protein [Desulfoscipio gibsoniae]AGL01666.1 flagellar biosynthesis pathway, component FlhB [Desulfoscipio gibsoniae DSM 7213]